MSGARRRVVVIGAGFGGLETAKALAGEPVEVVVIDRRNHHCFQPLLYQVATAALSPADIAWPIRGILRGQANATVLMAEIAAIDPQARVAPFPESRPRRSRWAATSPPSSRRGRRGARRRGLSPTGTRAISPRSAGAPPS